jgi:hypothetical protein
MSEEECDELRSHNVMLRKENDTLAKEIVKKNVIISQQNDAIMYLEETCHIYSTRFVQLPLSENLGATSPTGEGELAMPIITKLDLHTVPEPAAASLLTVDS